jgi:hypothetical protein
MSKSLYLLVSIFANLHSGISRAGGLGYFWIRPKAETCLPAEMSSLMLWKSFTIPQPITPPLSCRYFPDHYREGYTSWSESRHTILDLSP